MIAIPNCPQRAKCWSCGFQ